MSKVIKKVERPEGVSEQTWHDFKKVRKEKRAALTQTALDRIISQVEIVGWTLEDALKECCDRGWQSFKAEWVKSRKIESDDLFAKSITLTSAQRKRRDELRKQFSQEGV